MIDQSVADVMTSSVRTVSPETTASAVARLFADDGIGSAIVVGPDSDEILGIVTESDIMRQVASDADVTTTPVASFMTTPVTTIRRTDSITAAATVMKANAIRRLPVVDDGELVGMLTTTNLAHYVPRLRDAIHRTRHEARGR